MNLPTFTLARALGGRSLVVPGSLNAERASRQINIIEAEASSSNGRIFAFDKGKATPHGAADERISGGSARIELFTAQCTRKAAQQILTRCLVRNVAHKQPPTRIHPWLGAEDVHGREVETVGPPQELLNGIGGVPIPMPKADANIGRYLPNDSDALDRSVASGVDVLEDGVDDLLLADGPVGGADEGYSVVGRAIFDDDTAGFDKLLLVLTELAVDSLHLHLDVIFVGLSYDLDGLFRLGLPGIIGMLNIDLGDGLIDVGGISSLSLFIGKGDASGLRYNCLFGNIFLAVADTLGLSFLLSLVAGSVLAPFGLLRELELLLVILVGRRLVLDMGIVVTTRKVVPPATGCGALTRAPILAEARNGLLGGGHGE